MKEELVIKEAKKMELDITEEIESIELFFTPPDYGGNLEFFETQADYLDISVEEYYENHFKERLKRAEYFNKYFHEVLEPSKYSTDDWKEVDKEFNQYLEDLLVAYEEDIEINIK